MQQLTWLALGYNVPVHPSKNRVYVWRKLKEFGAGYFKQGVAILPKSPQSMTQLRGLAARIREMGGDATLAELRFCDAKDEQETVRRFVQQSELEYLELIADCAGLMDNIRENLTPSAKNDQLSKMKRRYVKVKSRDYFKSRGQDQVVGSVEDLVKDMARVGDELAKQLRSILEL